MEMEVEVEVGVNEESLRREAGAERKSTLGWEMEEQQLKAMERQTQKQRAMYEKNGQVR